MVGIGPMMLSSIQAVEAQHPNIIYIMSDDHALQAIGAYDGWAAKVSPTPNIDRIAKEGAIFKNNFCANSICGPSRACVITGKQSHMNGMLDNHSKFDGSQVTAPKLLQKSGYSTAIFGKWHLVSNPTGFDEWMVLPGQGDYYNPDYLTPEGKKRLEGYVPEVTTDLVIDYLKRQKSDEKPFFLMCHYKAPHRNWMPGPKYLNYLDGVEIPEPSNLFDDYANRAKPASQQDMSIERTMNIASDLKLADYSKGPPAWFERMNPEQKKLWTEKYVPVRIEFEKKNLSGKELTKYKFQRYMEDYLRCVKAVDDNVGRILEYLDKSGLAANTIVIYSSDQGFYLGEHGWFDKRWMYEESFRMPLLMRWPGKIKPGTEISALTQNIDFAPTFLDASGAPPCNEMQGMSLLPLLDGKTPDNWRKSLYYHYYEFPKPHNVPPHYGVRTDKYKLIHYYKTDEWEMFDMEKDPHEMRSIYSDPSYSEIRKELESELVRLQKYYQVPEDLRWKK